MIKKLLALLLLSTAAHAFSPVRYVQISTNTLTKQTGTVNVSSFTASSATITGPFTATGAVTLGSTASSTTVTISSNAVMPGATFYGDGSIFLGAPTKAITISSNTILPGATFYANGISSFTTIIVSTITPIHIIGTATNDNATVGTYGEYISTFIAGTGTTISLSNAVFVNVAVATITAPGDWDISWTVCVASNNATTSNVQDYVVSLFSGNTTTDHTLGVNWFQAAQVIAAFDQCFTGPRWRLSTTTTPNVFIKARGNFSAGTEKAYGTLNIRRAR